jgi:predicted unusual protein kinase regulating ubiquinone biosynthesis (AarF/ABC1/UbiB family)
VSTLLRHLPRVWHVLVVLTAAFVAPVLPFRRGATPGGPARLRAAFEELGGAWIKLGQMLAMRFDLLPAAYCEELFKLLNEVASFPYDQAREIIRQELGALPEVVFRTFAPTPFAAASIGQVYRAVLPTGETVAVKVQRPRIRQILQTDIELMFAVTWLLDWTHLFGATRSRAVIEEFARWTADELDFLVEARQAALLFEHARGEPGEQIAKVYRAYTSSRVLTTELIEGIPLLEILTAVRAGNRPYLDDLAARGYDLRRVVRRLDWNMLNQVYVFGCFHADLHPANLYVLPGDAIGYVDFGVVGQLPDDVRDSLTRYSWLLFQWDVEGAVRELMRWLAPTSATDAAAARQQLVRLHQAFLYDVGDAAAPAPAPRATTAPALPAPAPRATTPPALPAPANGSRPGRDPGAANPYSRLAVDVMQTVRRYELELAPGVVAYLRMLVTLGTLRHQLAPDYDLPAHVRRFFSRLLRQQGAGWLDPRLALGRLYAGTFRARRALQLVELLEAQEPLIAAAGSAYFGVRRRLHAIRRRVIGLGVAALVVGAALYVVLANPQGTQDVLPREVSYTWVHFGLLAVLVLLLLTLIAHVRRLSRVE